MNKRTSRIRMLFIGLFLLLAPVFVMSQDIDARSPKPSGGSHQQRKADLKKEKQKKQLGKAIDKGKKRHLKIQERETKKMMRRSKKKAKKWNNK